MSARRQEQPEDASVQAAGEQAEASAAGRGEAPEEQVTLQQEVEELRDKNLRLVAELQNLQKRAQREQTEAVRYAEANFARDLLVVIDDLERTLASAQEFESTGAVADGVRIVYEHLLKVFEQHGIRPIVAEGQPFDPDVHEAMLQQPSNEVPAGTVVKELNRGYKMHARVLRPSRVIVSSGAAAAADEGSEG